MKFTKQYRPGNDKPDYVAGEYHLKTVYRPSFRGAPNQFDGYQIFKSGEYLTRRKTLREAKRYVEQNSSN